jgi:hypothetical protein
MYSKIHIFYESLDYRQFEEVKQPRIYLAFCDFGNVIGFYWGMSIVSFFHVLFYLPRYLYYYYWQTKKGSKSGKVIKCKARTVRVAPLHDGTAL